MHKPQKVVYVELLDSRALAMKREKAIKKLSHRQKEDLSNERKSTNATVNSPRIDSDKIFP